MTACGALILSVLCEQAFMAASLKSDEELVDWFRQRLVWDDPAVVVDLLKRGLFSRIYTPQVGRKGRVGIDYVASLGV